MKTAKVKVRRKEEDVEARKRLNAFQFCLIHVEFRVGTLSYYISLPPVEKSLEIAGIAGYLKQRFCKVSFM